MTPEQTAAFVNAQAALLNAEIQSMVAANQDRLARGLSMAYGEEEFCARTEQYESVLSHNAVLQLYQDHAG